MAKTGRVASEAVTGEISRLMTMPAPKKVSVQVQSIHDAVGNARIMIASLEEAARQLEGVVSGGKGFSAANALRELSVARSQMMQIHRAMGW